MLLALALGVATALRFGPLPVATVPPGETAVVSLADVVVASDPAGVRLLSTEALGVPARAGGGLAVEVGPAPAGPGLHAVRLVVGTEAGESAAATLVVAVAERPERTVVLRYRPEGAPGKVVAAGEFNGWNQGAHPLADADGDGVWETTLRLLPGRYMYKFVVDGNWIPDPANTNRVPDGFGGENTVLVVEGAAPGAPPRLLPRRLEPSRAVVEFVAGADGADLAGVIALVDGAIVEAAHRAGVIEVPLPADGLPHDVRVVAQDAAGRIARFAFPVDERAFDWRDAVLYYAVTDRFHNGDYSNDSPIRQEDLAPQANYVGGDWIGIRRSIEEGYFERLGVNAIWISPHLDNPESAMRDALPPHRLFTGYHGYWPVDSTRTEARFGSEEDLRAMIEAAHARGIKVLFDMVYTHVHEDHPLYRADPDRFVPLVLPDGRRNIRLFDEFPMTTWFDDFLPKIDYEDDTAVAYQIGVTLDWIDRTGVDGFRLDAVKHIPHRFWRRLRSALLDVEARRGERFYLVGESIDSRKTISSFIAPAMLDGQFDFPLYWTIRSALALGTEGLDRLEAEIARGEREYPEGSIMSPLIGNHDVSRLASYCDGDLPPGTDEKALAWGNPIAVDSPAAFERVKTAFTLLFSLDGVPMVYYGDEIGMAGAHDPDNRRRMRFGDLLTDAERGVLDHVSRAGAARRAHPALRRGVRRPLLADAERLAFLKMYFGDAALTAIRRGGGDGSFDLEVAPDLPDGLVLEDALGSGIRATVENGRVRFTLPPLSSAILVPEPGA